MPSKIQQVMDDIATKIDTGTYRPGDRLASGRQLCASYSESMMTVRMAPERLKSAGRLTSSPGSGVYVLR